MSAAEASHPTRDQLAAFDQGRLAPQEWSAIEHHLADCNDCCGRLETVPDDDLVTLMRAAVKPASTMEGFDSRAETLGGAAKADRGPPEAPAELAEHPRYRILELLGSGGMGSVFKAEHRLMNRQVALKVVHGNLVDNPAAVERFRQEVQAAARLSHPNIVTAHDAEQAGKVHFLVMEFVPGETLDHKLAREGRLNVPEVCGWIEQAALGLQHASERGMVHRDIKPGNLLLTRDGQIKILDFGLARFASELGGKPLTVEGSVLGTPDYMAPEQAIDPHQADIRADIYSLGCTLYHLLAGWPPFAEGTAVQKLMAHQERRPKPLAELRPDVPAALAAVVERMMAKDPAGRFQTPAEAARALAMFARPAEETLLSPGPGRRHHRFDEPDLAGDRQAPAQRKAHSGRAARPGPPYPGGEIVQPGRALRRRRPGPDPRRRFPPFPALGPDRRQGGGGTFTGHSGDVLGLAFSADGREVLSGSVDTTVRLWDARSQKLLKTVPGHTGWVRAVAFVPGKKQALAGDNHANLIHWDLETGKIVHQLPGHQANIGYVAVDPTGRHAASSSWDLTARLWDLAHGKQMHKLEGTRANALVFSHDGRRLLSGHTDNVARLWDVRKGAELIRFTGHTGEVKAVALTADGTHALTGGSDLAVRLWDTATGNELHRFTGHEKEVLAVVFLPDGRRAISAGQDGTFRIWRLPVRQENGR
jgi:serine/threonine protein kinase